MLEHRNANRRQKLQEEQARLGNLPPTRLDHAHRIDGIKVSRSSTIQVKRNTYSVPSRLIGHEVDIVIDADDIEVRYADE